MKWLNGEDVIQSILEIVKSRDLLTYHHLIRVSEMMKGFGSFLNLSNDVVERLYYSGLFHDVGKIVFKYIHYSSKSLTPTDFELIRLHPVISANVVEPLAKGDFIVPAIRHHHERIDGRGYPDGLKDDEIPYGARIVAIVDAFDAIRWRPYNGNELKGIEYALEKMCLENEEDGCQWDRSLLDMFYLFCMENTGKIEAIFRRKEIYETRFVLKKEGDV